MDYRLWVLIHILGVAGFLAAHGVSMWAAFRVRRERNRGRIEGILQLSGSSTAFMYVSMLVLLVGGVGAGFSADWWSQAWIWLALGLLIAISVVMVAVSAPYYRRVKEAVQMRPSGVPRASDEELAELLHARAPLVSAWLGIATLVAILYLMVWKPF
jgi:uncharacterized membrane protein